MKQILSLLLIASLFGCSTPEKELENTFTAFPMPPTCQMRLKGWIAACPVF